MAKSEVPELTDKQWAFLCLYRELQEELGGQAPSIEQLRERSGHTHRSGAQSMRDTLVEMGLIELPEVKLVGGGVTKLGLKVLKRNEGRE